jgi:hypothetical protein
VHGALEVAQPADLVLLVPEQGHGVGVEAVGLLRGRVLGIGPANARAAALDRGGVLRVVGIVGLAGDVTDDGQASCGQSLPLLDGDVAAATPAAATSAAPARTKVDDPRAARRWGRGARGQDFFARLVGLGRSAFA